MHNTLVLVLPTKLPGELKTLKQETHQVCSTQVDLQIREDRISIVLRVDIMSYMGIGNSILVEETL